MTSPVWPAASVALTCGRTLLRILWTLAVVGYALLAAFGALSSPTSSLVLGTAFGIAGRALMASLHRNAGQYLAPLPHPAVAGIALALLPAATAGTNVLGAAGGAVVGIALIVGLPVGGILAVSRLSAPGRGRSPTVPSAVDRSLEEVLSAVPTDMLFAEWRTTAGETAPGYADDRWSRLRLRGLLIDELLRRDPDGTARWLVEDPDGPPDAYVRDQHRIV